MDELLPEEMDLDQLALGRVVKYVFAFVIAAPVRIPAESAHLRGVWHS